MAVFAVTRETLGWSEVCGASHLIRSRVLPRSTHFDIAQDQRAMHFPCSSSTVTR